VNNPARTLLKVSAAACIVRVYTQRAAAAAAACGVLCSSRIDRHGSKYRNGNAALLPPSVFLFPLPVRPVPLERARIYTARTQHTTLPAATSSSSRLVSYFFFLFFQIRLSRPVRFLLVLNRILFFFLFTSIYTTPSSTSTTCTYDSHIFFSLH